MSEQNCKGRRARSLLIGLVSLAAVLTLASPDVGYCRTRVGRNKVFGIGAHLGDPMSLTAKYWAMPNFGIAVNFGSKLTKLDGDLSVDLLYQIRNLTSIRMARGFEVGAHLGVGLGVGSIFGGGDKKKKGKDGGKKDGSFLGGGIGKIRAVLGVNILSSAVPLELFLEATPTLEAVPNLDFLMDLGLGFRYYFY